MMMRGRRATRVPMMAAVLLAVAIGSLGSACSGLVGASSLPQAAAHASDKQAAFVQPNIVFILADDLGFGDFSYNPSPSTLRLPTPNADRLAAEGMRFTDAYTGHSTSAPSRLSLLTGKHVGHLNVENPSKPLMPRTPISVVQTLRNAGYETALIGKWDLDGNPEGPAPPAEGFPTSHGFGTFLGQSGRFECNNYYPSWMFSNAKNTSYAQNANASASTCGRDYNACAWTGDLWTDAAEAFLKRHARPSSISAAVAAPFFLQIAYTTPHAGAVGKNGMDDIPVPRASKGPFANESWPQVEINYATAIYELDQLVGRIMDAVDSNGLRNSTIIFLASANGAHNDTSHQYTFFNSSGILNGLKGSIHDGGHRTGFVARWPGMIPQNVTTWQQFAFYDFYPTVAELAGIPKTALPSGLDGQSIAKALLTGTVSQPTFLYHEATKCTDPMCVGGSSPQNCDFGQNIRMGNWSGVCVGPAVPCTPKLPGRFFLYDMSVDQSQQKDVSLDHPDIVAAILSLMKSQHKKPKPSR